MIHESSIPELRARQLILFREPAAAVVTHRGRSALVGAKDFRAQQLKLLFSDALTPAPAPAPPSIDTPAKLLADLEAFTTRTRALKFAYQDREAALAGASLAGILRNEFLRIYKNLTR